MGKQTSNRKKCLLDWILRSVVVSVWVLGSQQVGHASESIAVTVDTSNLNRHLLVSEIEIPVKEGRQAFWYPKWIPGIHGPGEQIRNIGGLKISSSAGRLNWQRDPDDLYRFFVDVPAGVKTIRAELTYIASQPTRVSRGVDSYGNNSIYAINFNTCLIYPENASARKLPVKVAINLPADWGYATSLREDRVDGEWHHFKAESLERVVDSPLIAGRNYRQLEVESSDFPPVGFHFVSENPAALQFDDEQIRKYERLVAEAAHLFGGAPFDRYDFLVICSDDIPGLGLEHLSSSLNSIDEQSLVKEDELKGWSSGLLPHELVHAWCGKYRRPAGMYRDNFHDGKQTELLWIYEGLTQYLGQILTTRSGLISADQEKDQLAARVGYLKNRAGRDWRSLQDTAIAAYTLRGGSRRWSDLRRNQDYYDEGALFWLEVDATLRRLTSGEKSLDDFCRAFFAVPANVRQPIKPFTVDEVVSELEKLAPYDWQGLIRRRILVPQEQLPLDVLAELGYELTFESEPTEALKLREKQRDYISAEYSIGITIDKENQISSVVPGSLADQVGISEEMEIVGINEKKFTTDRFRDALQDSTASGEIRLLLLDDNDSFHAKQLPYRGGPRYPSLSRLEKTDWLSEILQPKTEFGARQP
ncbi:MAG: M61 family metallopeptidase [Planctomycetaceae bacterium]|nr:M61 family metallopeptidase [Planctomycetaceae bacterium]